MAERETGNFPLVPYLPIEPFLSPSARAAEGWQKLSPPLARNRQKRDALGEDDEELKTMSAFDGLQRRIDGASARLDEILSEHERRARAQLAREDAAFEEAQRQRQRAHAERKREIQATYADAFRSLGVEVPLPVADEGPLTYRMRLFDNLRRRLAPDHDLANLRADEAAVSRQVFENFESQLLEAARLEGERPSPSNLPDDGTLLARHRVDDNNVKYTDWFGNESFIKAMGRPARRVLRFVHPAHGAIWGAPFSRAS